MPGRIAAPTARPIPSCWSTATTPPSWRRRSRSVVADLVADEERDAGRRGLRRRRGRPGRGGRRLRHPAVPVAPGASWSCATSAASPPTRWRRLLAYLEDPLPTTVLVLVAGGGTVAPKLAAAVKAHGPRRSDQGGSDARRATGSVSGSGRRRFGSTARPRPSSRPTSARTSAAWARCSTCWSPPTARAHGVGPAEVEPVPRRGRLGRPVDLHRRHRRRPHGRCPDPVAPAARRRANATRSWSWPSSTATCSPCCGSTARRSETESRRRRRHGHRPGAAPSRPRRRSATAQRWGSRVGRRGRRSGGRGRARPEGCQRLAARGRARGAGRPAVPPGPLRRRQPDRTPGPLTPSRECPAGSAAGSPSTPRDR